LLIFIINFNELFACVYNYLGIFCYINIYNNILGIYAYEIAFA